jgi:choline dehydrogenase
MVVNMSGRDAYDFVIVGAGAAGCVVAARLAATGSEVLLLEAGPDLRADTPEAFRDGWGIDPGEHSWGFESEPNPRGNVQNVWRTKALGGTSWLTRFAPRGSPADYEEWAAAGNKGWGWEDVLPYLKRIERDVDYAGDSWHGDGGPIPVDRYLSVEYGELAGASMPALEELGFPAVDDHNRPGAVGVGRMPFSTAGGRRVTTLNAYLPADGAPANLTVRADAHVGHVVFEGTAARGVRLAGGEFIDAAQVVLCAGVYGTPPLLMRSGIGPANDLRALEIPVLSDLPGVGRNLADHPVVDIVFGGAAPPRDGPMLHYIATFRSSRTPATAPPDLMLWGGDPEEDAFELGVVLLKPRSRGSVRLRSADPEAPPVIELPALIDPSDHARLVEAYRRALELVNHPDVVATVGPPPPEVAPADLSAHVYSVARSLPHVVGTCAMGPRPEEGAVVDTAGHVHGTESLTVVDASVMPDVPSGFTHFPTIMIAERLAEQLVPAR